MNTIGDIFTVISGILHLSTVLAIFQDGRHQAIFVNVSITKVNFNHFLIIDMIYNTDGKCRGEKFR